jgi:hypothetical protein
MAEHCQRPGGECAADMRADAGKPPPPAVGMDLLDLNAAILRRRLVSSGHRPKTSNSAMRQLLAHPAVNPLPQQVGVTAVAGVLLDHVDQHLA